jgi:hypothetical protein
VESVLVVHERAPDFPDDLSIGRVFFRLVGRLGAFGSIALVDFRVVGRRLRCHRESRNKQGGGERNCNETVTTILIHTLLVFATTVRFSAAPSTITLRV